MASDKKDDDLLRRAREAQRQADENLRDVNQLGSSTAERLVRDSAWIQRFVSLSNAAKKYLGPIGTILAWIINLLIKWFRWAGFEPSADDSDDPGVAVFSSRRFLLRSLLSVVALLMLHVALSAAYYYATYFNETVYVTGKQEIETGELYQFGGCTSLPCSTETDNGKFYLIESSLYFPVMYYPEENVFANIPQQDSACKVGGYGIYFRTLRWLYKSAQLYQHVVDVSCRPYTVEEIRRAVEKGEIVRDD